MAQVGAARVVRLRSLPTAISQGQGVSLSLVDRVAPTLFPRLRIAGMTGTARFDGYVDSRQSIPNVTWDRLLSSRRFLRISRTDPVRWSPLRGAGPRNPRPSPVRAGTLEAVRPTSIATPSIADRIPSSSESGDSADPTRGAVAIRRDRASFPDAPPATHRPAAHCRTSCYC